MSSSKEEIKSIMDKYKSRLDSSLTGNDITDTDLTLDSVSKEYNDFRNQYVTHKLGWYEKLCKIGKGFGITPDDKRKAKYEDAIETCHLSTTPEGMMGVALLSPMIIMVFGSMLVYALTQSMMLIMVCLILAVGVMYFFMRYPISLASRWKIKAGNESVLSIFYIVTFMRHTSNLELAVNFASNHLTGLLAMDFKKILWDVENQVYETIQVSIEKYLDRWKEWNPDFVEALHLIESSLYESSEVRRIELLDKSLTVILEGSYERMLRYARELKGPITNLHMLGIILPILGLVILPLIVSFMQGSVQWYHIAALYNILIPFGVYYVGTTVLEKRPSSYGETEIRKDNPEYQKLLKEQEFVFGFKPKHIAIIIIILGFIGGLLPIFLHVMDPTFDITLASGEKILDYKLVSYNGGDQAEVGPFGVYSTILGVLVPLGLGVGFGLYYRFKSSKVIEMRNKTSELESEFSSALFQLGSRLGDGLPAEIAFSKVSENMKKSKTADFFNIVTANIMSRGMNLSSAIFDNKVGAMINYPSNIIKSSMKVLSQSIKKGPKIAAVAMMSISTYLKEIRRVDEKLKDLLDEVSSSIKSQIKFIAPLIAGIVIGLSSMVTTILARLQEQMGGITNMGGSGANVGGLTGMLSAGLPTYYIQIIVGLYIVEIVYVLSILLNGIEKGVDKLNKDFLLGQYLFKGIITFTIVSVALILLFGMITNSIMGPSGIF